MGNSHENKEEAMEGEVELAVEEQAFPEIRRNQTLGSSDFHTMEP